MDKPINLPIQDSNGGVVNEYKPRMGMTFCSEQEAYAFYNRFGGSVGFSIRRAYAYKLKEDKNIIKQRTIECCKEVVQALQGKDRRDIDTRKP